MLNNLQLINTLEYGLKLDLIKGNSDALEAKETNLFINFASLLSSSHENASPHSEVKIKHALSPLLQLVTYYLQHRKTSKVFQGTYKTLKFMTYLN